MILDPTGRIAHCRTLPLTSLHARALLDGDFFLERGLDVLATADLEPYCRYCAAAGTAADVYIAQGEQEVTFRCAHTGGWAKLGRNTLVEGLLDALNWDIRCSSCRQPVQADNDPNAVLFHVNCPCTTRTLPNPAAPGVAN